MLFRSEDYYEKALYTIFAEKTVDNLYEGSLPIDENENEFAVEFLPGHQGSWEDPGCSLWMVLCMVGGW